MTLAAQPSAVACPGCIAAPGRGQDAPLRNATLALSVPTIHCQACIATVEQALLIFQLIIKQFNTRQVVFKDLAIYLNKEESQNPGSVLAYQGDKIIPVYSEDIQLFYISDDKVFAHTKPEQAYRINDKLDNLEQLFPHFFRANRQFLINRKAVKDVSQYFNRKLRVNLQFSFPDPVIVSRLKANDFLHWLQESL